MGTLILLATEASAELAEAAEEGGFGLNFDILETNIINLAIAIFLLVYLGRKFLGGILTTRKTEIEASIQAAEQRRKTAAAALAEQQQKLAQAQTEAERIRASAEEAAKATREAILAQAQQDIQRLRESAAQDMGTDQDRAIAELRRRVVELSLQQVESQLTGRLDESAQQQLIDRSLTLLGG
ncbi:MAG: F0F1 ATP synthase subunit B [Leptolyngbyaceae cyanobacterium bins.59]|nr:F0F1 ATP synthase subunit B [Leptolyngbyaceae cyanobacterium bins.59]